MYAISKLRIGIVLGSTAIPAWQAALLRSLAESVYAQIVFCATHACSTGPNRSSLIYRTFRSLEHTESLGGPDALAPQSVDSVLAGIDNDLSRSTWPRRQPDFIDALRSSDLDVLVVLSDVAAFSNAGALARHGLWYFAAGDQAFMPPDGSMIGFREVLCREPSLEGSLRVRMDDEIGELNAVSTRSTVHARSHLLTCNEHLWKCSTFVSRAIRKLFESGSMLSEHSPLDVTSGTSGRRRTNMTLALGRYLLRRVWTRLRDWHTSERWILQWARDNADPRSGRFLPLTPPPGRFWADPHVLEKDGVTHVFFEDAECRSGKGHIAHIALSADGSMSAPVPLIQRSYHLSYPFVFEWRGDLFMIPESAENRTVELYRCTRFPDKWEFVHVMIEGISAYDATVIEHAGRWWMFATVAERPGASSWDELCIFHSDSPVSRVWRAHLGNPVISDVGRARPAGRFFWEGQDLVRPSQDSTGRYGRALVFSKVQELSERVYREVRLRSVEPDWDSSIVAIHSYSKTSGVTLIDAIRREPE